MSEYVKSLEARLATPVRLPERYSIDCGVCADPNGEWLSHSDVVAALCEHKLTANRHDESNYPEIPEGCVVVPPEGCVVVPLAPTTEMIAAAMDSIDVTFDDDDYIFVYHDTIYAAMLAAAPKLDGCK